MRSGIVAKLSACASLTKPARASCERRTFGLALTLPWLATV
jgi:hypothetical protein